MVKRQCDDGLLSPYLRWRRIKAALPFMKGSVLDFGCHTGALRRYYKKGEYFGVDIDEASLRLAEEQYPSGCFSNTIPSGRLFDTIVLLAVIKYLVDPGSCLKILAGHLRDSGRLIVTTPAPCFDKLYRIGAGMGVFSMVHAAGHQKLMGEREIMESAGSTGLIVERFSKFLCGANQLFILKKN